MKKKIVISLIMFIVGSVCLMKIKIVKAFNNEFIEKETTSTQVEDLTLYHTSGTINQSNQNFYHIDFNPQKDTNYALVAWAINENGISGNVKSTIMQMAKDYEEKHPDEIIVAGINADYFAMSTGKYDAPFSAQVVNGDVHQLNVFTKNGYDAGIIGINENNQIISSSIIKKSTSMYVEVLDDNQNIVYQTPINAQTMVHFGDAIGKNIHADTLYVVSSPTYVRPNAFGKGKISVITTDYQLTTKEFAIETTNATLQSYLKQNAIIRVQYHPLEEFATCNNIIGFYGSPLKNGKILENGKASEGKAGGPPTQSIMTSKNPRTSLGIKEDGTIVLGVIDGRQSTIGSEGVTSKELAKMYQELGCTECFMFDGGGSSTLIARVNGELSLINSPSDGSMRKVTNGLFIVKKKNENVQINPKIRNITTDGFTIDIDPKVINGIKLEKIWAVVNGVAYLMASNHLEVKNLEANQNVTIQFQYAYVVNQQEIVEEASDRVTITLASISPTLQINVGEINGGKCNIYLDLDLKNHQFIEATFTLQNNGKVKQYQFDPNTKEIELTDLMMGNTYTFTTILKYKDITTDKVEVIYGPIQEFSYATQPAEAPAESNNCTSVRNCHKGSSIYMIVGCATLLGIASIIRKKRKI